MRSGALHLRYKLNVRDAGRLAELDANRAASGRGAVLRRGGHRRRRSAAAGAAGGVGRRVVTAARRRAVVRRMAMVAVNHVDEDLTKRNVDHRVEDEVEREIYHLSEK